MTPFWITELIVNMRRPYVIYFSLLSSYREISLLTVANHFLYNKQQNVVKNNIIFQKLYLEIYF